MIFIHFFLQMTNVVPVQRRHNYVRLLTSSQLGHLFGHFLCNTPSNGKHYWNPKMKKSSTLCTDRRPVKPHRLRHQSPSPGWLKKLIEVYAINIFIPQDFQFQGNDIGPQCPCIHFSFMGYEWLNCVFTEIPLVKVIINIKFSFKPVLQSIWFLLPIVRHSDDQV